MTKRAAPLFLLLLAGCGSARPDGDSRIIACGPDGGAVDRPCTLEVSDEAGTLRLVLRQPEGGFRRLVWPKGGALSAADGADALQTARLPGGGVEARIGGWTYRIEAKGGGLP
jgi:hypothetical protein